MDIHEHQGGLTVRRSDLSGSVFDDVNLSGTRITNANLSGAALADVNLTGLRLTDANLSGAAITASRYDGMTIEGIAVPDLLAAWRRQAS